MSNVRIMTEKIKKPVLKNDFDAVCDASRSEYEHKSKLLALLDDKVLESISKLTQNMLKNNENIVFFPVAIYMALIVLAKLTDENIESQILELLGIDEYKMDSA